MSTFNPRIEGADVRIMSSNILFDKTLEGRLPLIADYYRASDADVIGMQEVNRVGTTLFEALGDIYTPVARRHAEDKHCFTPILYRHDRFEMIESESLQVFADTVTDQDLEMIPLSELPDSWNKTEIFITPPQNL